MKSNMLIILIGLLVTNTGCSLLKNQNTKNTMDVKNHLVLGEVRGIENGRDGYTAEIKTSNEELYFATISIPNIGSVEGYQRLEKGKKVALRGDYWKLGDKNRLTVREILSADNDNFELSGKAKSFNHGGDGYTVKVITNETKEYYITISFSNLGKNHSKYKEYKLGETAHVVGELWKMGDELHVTARDILLTSKNKANNLELIIGEVKSIHKGTDGINSFLLIVTTPNGSQYDAMIDDLTLMDRFEAGKKVALKGELRDIKYLFVKEIISTDTEDFVVKGIVETIKNEMDGNVITIKTEDGEVYQVTLSIANMDEGKEFKTFKVGETAHVRGEFWLFSGKKQITVREILP